MEILISKELPVVRNEGPIKSSAARTEPARSDGTAFNRLLKNNHGVEQPTKTGTKTGTEAGSSPDRLVKNKKNKTEGSNSVTNAEALFSFFQGLTNNEASNTSAAVNNEGTVTQTTQGTQSQESVFAQLFGNSVNQGTQAATDTSGAAVVNEGAITQTTQVTQPQESVFAQLFGNSVNHGTQANTDTSGAAVVNEGTVTQATQSQESAFAQLFGNSVNHGTQASADASVKQADTGANIAGLSEFIKLSQSVQATASLQSKEQAVAALNAIATDLKPSKKVDLKLFAGETGKQAADKKVVASGEAKPLFADRQIETASLNGSSEFNAGQFKDKEQEGKGTEHNVTQKAEGMFLHADNKANARAETVSTGRLERVSEKAAVSDKAFVLSKKGEASIDISIEPDGLGKLDIQLSLDKGTVNAHINASQTAGKDMLEKNINQIMDALVKEGLNVGGFSVSLRNRDGYANNYAARDSSGNGNARNIETSENIAQLPGYTGNNLINIFV